MKLIIIFLALLNVCHAMSLNEYLMITTSNDELLMEHEVIGMFGSYNVSKVILEDNDIRIMNFETNIEINKKYNLPNYQINNVQNTKLWGLDQLDSKVDQTYNYYYTGKDVNVYVIDSGLTIIKNIFQDRIKKGYNVDDDSSNTPDCIGHGTHVASTIGSTTYGVAKEVNIIPVKIFGCSGSTSTSNVVKALSWIYNNINLNKKNVINMSIGGSLSELLNLILVDVSKRATIVVAAGNDANDACFYSPASSKNVITVGAMNDIFIQAPFSNWGSCVTLFAPGQNICGADNDIKKLNPVCYSGTSMASPHVAGMIAITYEKFPDIPKDDVGVVLLSYCQYDRLLLNPRYASITPNINLQGLPNTTFSPTSRPTSTNSPSIFRCSMIKNRERCNKHNKCRWRRYKRICVNEYR